MNIQLVRAFCWGFLQLPSALRIGPFWSEFVAQAKHLAHYYKTTAPPVRTLLEPHHASEDGDRNAAWIPESRQFDLAVQSLVRGRAIVTENKNGSRTDVMRKTSPHFVPSLPVFPTKSHREI